MRLLCRRLGSLSPNLAALLRLSMGHSTCCVALSVCPFGMPTAFPDGRPVGMPTPVCVKCPVAPKSITPVGVKVLNAHLANDLSFKVFPPWPTFFVLAKFACSGLVGLAWGLDELLIRSIFGGLRLGPGKESLIKVSVSLSKDCWGTFLIGFPAAACSWFLSSAQPAPPFSLILLSIWCSSCRRLCNLKVAIAASSLWCSSSDLLRLDLRASLQRSHFAVVFSHPR